MRFQAPRLPFAVNPVADPVDLLVGMLVQPDDDCSCGEQVAVIEAAPLPHTGGLVCCSCGCHRGWLPRHAYNFITELIDKFGRPTEPVAYRRGPTSSTEGANMKFDNGNRGALFREEKKKAETDPDYSGTVNVNGADFWLKGWIKTATKSGKKFLSLSVRPKSESNANGKPPFNDSVDF